jgi:hypothetical protein
MTRNQEGLTLIPPSKCEQFVPTETTSYQSSLSWSIELAHETTCPNYPEVNHAA